MNTSDLFSFSILVYVHWFGTLTGTMTVRALTFDLRIIPRLNQCCNMVIQPVPFQFLVGHSLGSGNPALAYPVTGTTCTVKRLIHLPFRARIEEGESVTHLELLVINYTHLHLAHVEDD